MGKLLAVTHDTKNRRREPFGAINSERIIAVERGDHLVDIDVRLGGQVVVAGGAANGTSLGPNPGNLLNRIRLLAQSRGMYPGGELINLIPRTILQRVILDEGRAKTDAALTGAAGTFTLNQNFPLRRALPRAPRPFDTALPTDEYKGLALHIAVGGRDTQFTGNDRAWDFTGAFFDIQDYREKDVSEKPKGVLYESDDVLLIPAANQRLPYDAFPVGEALLDVLVIAEGTNQGLLDTILDNAILTYGGMPIFDKNDAEIKHAQVHRITDAAQADTGLYHLDFNKHALMYGAIPHYAAQDFKAIFNVANPSGANVDRLIIATRRVVWPERFVGRA